MWPWEGRVGKTKRAAPGVMNETADHMGDLKRKIRNFFGGVGGGAASGPPTEAPLDNREVPDIGSVLRTARVQAGLELRDVAAMLKIRYVFMLAIEDGRYHELPGTAYAVGFVRAYADYLGLDCDAVVRRFKDEVANKVSQPGLYFPTPVPEGRVPGGTILLFSVVLACLVYGGWYVLSATDRSMVDMVPALPQRLVSLLEGGHSDSGAAAPATPAPGPASAAGTTAASSGGNASGGNASGGNPAAASSPETDSAPPAPALLIGGAPRTAAPGDGRSGGALVSGAAAPGGAAGIPAGAGAPGSAVGGAPAAGAGVGAVGVNGIGAGGSPTVPEVPGGATVASDANADSGDEIPLVSGPADEAIGEPGPLVPMAPRNKPLPPGATPVGGADAPAPGAESETPPPPSPVTPATADIAPPLPVPPPNAAPDLPTGRVYGAQNRDSHVQIRATQDAWVQIRDADGDPVFTRVLHPGDVFRVPEHPGVRLRTGNAGGLEAIVDGGPPHPLGPVGQVLRDVLIDAAQLSRGTVGED